MWWLFRIALAIVVANLLEIPRYRAICPYYERACSGVRWRRRFPDASSQEIRDFLQLFVDSFGFRSKQRLRFRPDDKLLDLYQALNPPNWSIGDGCEFECLFDDFQERYHVDLVPLWREDLTLGEVFSYTRPRFKRSTVRHEKAVGHEGQAAPK